MSRKLPAITGTDAIKALEATGFQVVRIRGSHHVMKHPDGRTTVVPVHGSETLGPGLIGKIIRDSGLDKEAFRELLG